VIDRKEFRPSTDKSALKALLQELVAKVKNG